MKFSKLAILLLAVCLCLSIVSCDLLGGDSKELYVSMNGTFDGIPCELSFLSYKDRAAGKNIYDDVQRTVTYAGRTWNVYAVPAGSWTIYVEYQTDGTWDSWQTETANVNLADNEWAALYLESDDWVNLRSYANDGEFEIPGL
ncbi:MAG: hypothetical protein KKI09_16590 [Spirochaetes bacterium]|nr:hypothetical protein [Spirochaetota bacterium]MBU0957043.1 hypothetical protein [Spirochaetota bacterium]